MKIFWTWLKGNYNVIAWLLTIGTIIYTSGIKKGNNDAKQNQTLQNTEELKDRIKELNTSIIDINLSILNLKESNVEIKNSVNSLNTAIIRHLSNGNAYQELIDYQQSIINSNKYKVTKTDTLKIKTIIEKIKKK